MIHIEKINDMFFTFSDKDIGKYWPFEWIWIKGLFEWKNFNYDTSSLKSWKHVVGSLDGITYVFEEVKSKLLYITK